MNKTVGVQWVIDVNEWCEVIWNAIDKPNIPLKRGQ